MTARKLAKQLRETPMIPGNSEKSFYRLSPELNALLGKHRFQAVIMMNVAGNVCNERDSVLELAGYLGTFESQGQSLKTHLFLPKTFGEHSCHVLFHNGRLVELEPEPGDGETMFWYDRWWALANQTGSVREVTCYFNLTSGSVLHSGQPWKSAGKPPVWMTTNIARSALTELFDEDGTGVGMALVYPYRSLVHGKGAHFPGPDVLLPA